MSPDYIPILKIGSVVREKFDVRIACLSRWRSLSERYGIEARTGPNRTVDRRQSARSRKSPIPPAICKEFAGMPAKPCKLYRVISDDSRVRSTAWEFFTDDRFYEDVT